MKIFLEMYVVREYEINYSNFFDVQSHPGLRYLIWLESINYQIHQKMSKYSIYLSIFCPSTYLFIFSSIKQYCTSWNFRGGFIFANFASQTLAKISTSIYVYL